MIAVFRTAASRWVTAAVVALVTLVLVATPALAQDSTDTDKNILERGYDECVSIEDERGVLSQLVEDGLITEAEKDEAAGLYRYDADKVAKIREAHQERWDEILAHHQENRGLGASLGRFGLKTACVISSPLNGAAVAFNESAFWNDPIGKFVKSVLEGNTQALETAMTFWMDYSTSSVDVSANTQGVKNIVMGLSGFALMASFIIGGWRLVSSRRGGLQEGMTDINDNMLRWLVFSIAVPAMFPGAMVASDALADAIMEQFGGGVDNIVNLGGLEDTEFGPIAMLILAGVMLIGSVVQILALVTRVLIAPIAAGLTPLFAALSFTEAGKQGLNHLVSFLIAALAFKPVSALLYAVVLWNVGQGGDIGVSGGVVNALMIGLAGFAAPALVRAIVPVVAQAGGGGSAPMLAGAAGVVGGLAGAAGGVLSTAGRAVAGTGKSATGTGAQTTTSAATGTSTTTGGGVAARATGGGGAASTSTASQPSGASGSPSMRSRMAAGAGAAARGVRRGAGATLTGAGKLSQGTAKVASASGQAGRHVQGIFDDSIGTPGGYAGQVHR
ncbi:hypothetical protein [Corynebacterium vitaeruminis]|uniref:hypothetical protein n=1 Tax=Corynebacterium vitaeruminis TaxID=38305 RepID=UPI0004B56BC7|nr:hypothetical protein [Corynebacterium vitaeruminis]